MPSPAPTPCQVCVEAAAVKNSNLLLLRSLKPLRIIKLFKAFKIINALKEELAIVLGLTTVKMAALFTYLISSVHVCACGYWRIKIESSTEEDVNAFLTTRGVDPSARPDP
jgi:hypothetical protein